MRKQKIGKERRGAVQLVREPDGEYRTNGHDGNGHGYDLEERTFMFAKDVRALVKRLPRTIGNQEDARQLVRASGSVGANYIEANESLGKKDFLLRIKTSRKEAKESRFFLRLLDLDSAATLESERAKLVQESTELMNIFGAIYRKSSA